MPESVSKTILALAAALTTAAPFAADGQLIDPNNNCVYQPGSRTCEPIRAPVAPPVDGPPYQAFVDLANRSHLNLPAHPSYTSGYFDQRARLYCGLLGQGEAMKIVQQITFPPVVLAEPATGRSRLEVAILRVGTASLCPTFWPREQQIEATITR